MNDRLVRELRLVVTTDQFEEALRFYRDVLGMPEQPSVSSPHGRVAILDAGRATLEISDPPHAEFIDDVEVGRRVAGPVRVALEVTGVETVTRLVEQAGASVLAEPRRTPFRSTNARVDAPAGLQLTLFERLA
jgi:lactoylglutathione lyase